MTSYVVTYDLIKRKDYQKLWDELEGLGGHRASLSFWLVNVSNTARELRVHLESFVDSDDRIWVSELTKNHSFNKALKGTNDWIEANPPAR